MDCIRINKFGRIVARGSTSIYKLKQSTTVLVSCYKFGRWSFDYYIFKPLQPLYIFFTAGFSIEPPKLGQFKILWFTTYIAFKFPIKYVLDLGVIVFLMILMRKVKSINLLLAVLTAYLLLVQYTPLTNGTRTSNFLNPTPLPLLMAPAPAPAPAPSCTMHGEGNSTDDDLFGNYKRRVPSGANPLHNWIDRWFYFWYVGMYVTYVH